MTASELIKLLEAVPPDSEVWLSYFADLNDESPETKNLGGFNYISVGESSTAYPPRIFLS